MRNNHKVLWFHDTLRIQKQHYQTNVVFQTYLYKQIDYLQWYDQLKFKPQSKPCFGQNLHDSTYLILVYWVC